MYNKYFRFGVGVSVLAVGLAMTQNVLAATKAPLTELGKMWNALAQVKTAQYDGNIQVTPMVTALPNTSISDSIFSTAQFTVKITGSFDHGEEGFPKFASNVKATISNSLRPEENFDWEMKLRAMSDVLYIKMGQTSLLSLFGLDQLADKWIKIDPTYFKDELKGQLSETNRLRSADDLDAEQMARLADIMNRTQLIDVTKKFRDEMIDGNRVTHIAFRFNKTNLEKVYAEFVLAQSGTKMSKTERNEFHKQIVAAQLPTGELWLGKANHLPYRLTFAYTTPKSKASPAGTRLSYKVALNWHDYNQSVDIKGPLESTTLQEILEQVKSATSSPMLGM